MERVVNAVCAVLTMLVFTMSLDAEVACIREHHDGRVEEFISADRFINGFIEAVRAVDDEADWRDRNEAIQRVADFIDFPLQRMYPLPAIQSAYEFEARYSEVFDDEFVHLIVESGYDSCSYHPVYGFSLHSSARQSCRESGCIWFYESTIIFIDKHSEVEIRERERRIEAEKRNLHEILREFEFPVLDWETCTYRVRVDYLGDEKYRYASWYAGDRYDAEPDLVIDDGELAYGRGSIFPLYFYFSGGQFKYMMDVGYGRVLGGGFPSTRRRPSPGSLVVLSTGYTDAELRVGGCDDCMINPDLLRYGENIACYDQQDDNEREKCEADAERRRPAVMVNQPIVKGDAGWDIRASCHGLDPLPRRRW